MRASTSYTFAHIFCNGCYIYFVDREKPRFIGCPTNQVYLLRFEIATTPNVTDNSGAISTLNVSYNRPITEDIRITWTAADHAGNMADPCVVEIRVMGRPTYTISM